MVWPLYSLAVTLRLLHKRKIVVISLVLFFVLSGVLLLGFFQEPMWLAFWSEFRTADKIMDHVEAFRACHGYVPGEAKRDQPFCSPPIWIIRSSMVECDGA